MPSAQIGAGLLDAVAGLLSMREGWPFTIYAHEKVLAILKANSIFNVLSEKNVRRSTADAIAGLAEIIEEVTGIEPSEVTPEKSFVDDLDIDSLSMVEIAVQTEDKYGVKIPDEDLAGLRTVGDVVAYIQKLEEENPEAAAALREKFAQ